MNGDPGWQSVPSHNPHLAFGSGCTAQKELLARACVQLHVLQAETVEKLVQL